MLAEHEVVERIADRLQAIKDFLSSANNKAMLAPQNHLDNNSVERAYWHAGYGAALTDILNLLQQSSKTVN